MISCLLLQVHVIDCSPCSWTEFPLLGEHGASQVVLVVKNLPMQETQERRVQSLGQEDSPGGGNSDPLQYSCLGNPMDSGAWRATVPGAAKSQYLATKQQEQ